MLNLELFKNNSFIFVVDGEIWISEFKYLTTCFKLFAPIISISEIFF